MFPSSKFVPRTYASEHKGFHGYSDNLSKRQNQLYQKVNPLKPTDMMGPDAALRSITTTLSNRPHETVRLSSINRFANTSDKKVRIRRE